MATGERFRKMNLEIQEDIKKEIVRAEAGESDKDKGQFELILVELQRILARKGAAVGYPRVIIDEWNYQDKLGEELLDLYYLYERLQ